MTDLSRRFFIKFAVTSAGQVLLLPLSLCHADDPSPDIREGQARQKAESFLGIISRHSLKELQSMHFTFDVHLKVAWNVRMKMSATIWLEGKDNRFVSSFNLTEPEGINSWSWLMLTLFGRHTKEYKVLMEGIETRLKERFHYDSGRFQTDILEEIMPENTYYANQTAIKLQFEHTDKLIRFWEDKRQISPSRTLSYTGQIGPLTAFFNYLFFNKPETEMSIVNVLKQVEDDDTSPASSGKKFVRYLFESQRMLFGPNTSGKLPAYRMMISLKRGNFLDIIYGDYLFYQLAYNSGQNLKIPYAAHAEGIISKNKKRKKIKLLKKKFPHRESFEKELLTDVDDILATRNIKIFLTDYDVSLKS